MCELGMSALIRGNAPDLGDRGEERPPTGQELSLLIHRGAEFSRRFGRISGGKKKRILKKKSEREKKLTFYGETLQRRALPFYGREISGRAAAAIMHSHAEWSGAESRS